MNELLLLLDLYILHSIFHVPNTYWTVLVLLFVNCSLIGLLFIVELLIICFYPCLFNLFW